MEHGVDDLICPVLPVREILRRFLVAAELGELDANVVHADDTH
jgi:hypothetical protein